MEEGGARVVVIDSLNGYLNAMPQDHYLTAQLHELLSYLNNRGVATFLVVAQSGLMGSDITAPVEASDDQSTDVTEDVAAADGSENLEDALVEEQSTSGNGGFSRVKRRSSYNRNGARDTFDIARNELAVGRPNRAIELLVEGVDLSR